MCAAITFRIVVEDAVVGAGVRVGVPERGGTVAERWQLQLLLRQSLLHPGPQSLEEPAESCSLTERSACPDNTDGVRKMDDVSPRPPPKQPGYGRCHVAPLTSFHSLCIQAS